MFCTDSYCKSDFRLRGKNNINKLRRSNIGDPTVRIKAEPDNKIYNKAYDFYQSYDLGVKHRKTNG